MRIIYIRHAESSNNILSEISWDAYADSRSDDALVTENGLKDAILLGKYLKRNSFKIDKFYSSASKRGLVTMDIISKVYNQETPIELMVDLHEYGGCHIDDSGRPGMTDNEILEFVPRINIPNDIDLSSGWWKSEKKETEEEFKLRIRRVSQKLRDIAGSSEEDYTVCIVSHSLFMNSFFTSLIASEFLVENVSFGFSNLSISSFTLAKKNREYKIEFLNLPLDKTDLDE